MDKSDNPSLIIAKDQFPVARVNSLAARGLQDLKASSSIREGINANRNVTKAKSLLAESFDRIDEETYQAAYPHFEAALKVFQEAEHTIEILSKFHVDNFGANIKPMLSGMPRKKDWG